MADNTTRIARLEKAQEDISGKLEDIQDDTRYMRRQLDALKVEVREIPRVIVETVRESERRITASVSDAIAKSESGLLAEIGQTRTDLTSAIRDTEARLLAAIEAIKP